MDSSSGKSSSSVSLQKSNNSIAFVFIKQTQKGRKSKFESKDVRFNQEKDSNSYCSNKAMCMITACAISSVVSPLDYWISLDYIVEQYYWLSLPAYGAYIITSYIFQLPKRTTNVPDILVLLISSLAIALAFLIPTWPSFIWLNKPYPCIVLFSLAISATIYFCVVSPFLWY